MSRSIHKKITKPSWLTDQEFKVLLDELTGHFQDVFTSLSKQGPEQRSGLISCGCDNFGITVAIGPGAVGLLRGMLKEVGEENEDINYKEEEYQGHGDSAEPKPKKGVDEDD